MKASAFLFILLTTATSAQVLQIDAGTSTLGPPTTGAIVSAFLPNSTTTLSGGVQDGRISLGASDKFDLGKTLMTVGTQQLSQSVDGAGVSVTGVGVSAMRSDITHENAIGLFAGTVGVGVFMPYIKTATPQHIGGGLFARHAFRKQRLHVGALALDEGSLRTAVGSVSWNSQRLTATAVGGVLNNSNYFSGDGSYRLTKSVSFFGGHMSTMTPIKSTSDDAGGSFNVPHFSVTAMALRSTSFKTVDGDSISVGTTFGPVRNYVAEARSGSVKMLIDSAYEQVTRHWQAQEIFTRSLGSTNVGFGGGYQSNRVSFGVNYGVAFIPQVQAFQRTMTIHIEFSVHGTRMTAQTLTTSGLRPLYQVSGERWMQGPVEMQGVGHSFHSSSSGKYQIAGRVTDTEGNGLEGVAIIVGKEVLYSNVSGRFNVARKHAKSQTIRIDLDQSSVVGDWRVKDCPATATPAVEPTPEIHIVLIRP